MPTPREFIFGPWRAVSVLGVTEILSWGALFYPPVLTVPLIAQDHGWSRSFAMGGFSAGLFVGGLVSRYVGATIDRLGGHVVMPFGSLGRRGRPDRSRHGAKRAGLFRGRGWCSASPWRLSLYDPAFATLGRIFGAAARAPITTLTLAGGFASTVGWPATQYLIDAVGWRGCYLVYAALLALRRRAAARLRAAAPACRTRAARGDAGSRGEAGGAAAGAWVWRSCWSPPALPLTPSCRRRCPRSCSPFSAGSDWRPRPSSPSACCSVRRKFWRGSVNCLSRAGCIRCGSRASRSGFWLRLSSLLALFPFSAALAAVFAVMYGMANGLLTIARGTVPLALFGAAGYGRLVGRIGGPFLVVQAIAPVAVTYVAEHFSDAIGLTLVAAFAVAALDLFCR